MGKITKTVMSDIKETFHRKKDDEFKQSIISNFEIRKKRLDYFTYHVIKNLIYFKNEHYKLEHLLDECIKESNEYNIRKVTSIAKSLEEFNIGYNFSFTQHLLNNSTNFIANPWIVNKFLDYFHVFQTTLNTVSNISIYSFNNPTIVYNLQKGTKYNITKLDMCIEALNEERKLVYLEAIDKE